MRLTHFLNENKIDTTDSPIQAIKTLKRCSQIIGVYKTTKQFLYRGVKELFATSIHHLLNPDRTTGPEYNFIQKKSHIDDAREPRDMDQDIHDQLNLIFESIFGWKVRNGISTSPMYQQAETYGGTGIFFPPNGSKFCYSPKINDLWSYLDDKLYWGTDNELHWNDDFDIHKVIEGNYTDQNLPNAIKNAQGEIMFKAKNYYLLHFVPKDVRLSGHDERAFEILEALGLPWSPPQLRIPKF